jgi:hypothetical protein
VIAIFIPLSIFRSARQIALLGPARFFAPGFGGAMSLDCAFPGAKSLLVAGAF